MDQENISSIEISLLYNNNNNIPPPLFFISRRSIDGKSDYKKCSKALSCEVFPSVDNEKNRVDTTDAVSISLATKV